MYPYEHMITMECKEVCILGEVKSSFWETKNDMMVERLRQRCLCFANYFYKLSRPKLAKTE